MKTQYILASTVVLLFLGASVPASQASTIQAFNPGAGKPAPSISLSRPGFQGIERPAALSKPICKIELPRNPAGPMRLPQKVGTNLAAPNDGKIKQNGNVEPARPKKAEGKPIVADRKQGKPTRNDGGTTYNPYTEETTTLIWHPEEAVGGGMVRKGYWEKIVEDGDTTENHKGKF
jgi:hypothetical protein